MGLYGKDSKSHKDFVAVEHSRSCVSKCNFCVLWRQLGRTDAKGNFQLAYRTKSVNRTFEEVQMLHEKYKRKTFCWVDPTFNVSSKSCSDFADRIIAEGLDIHHTAWYRADTTIRDHKNGTLKKMVDAGLRQAMIGLERTDKVELESLEKNYTLEMLRECFGALQQYPQVLTVATYIYGLPDETPQSLRRFYKDLRTIPFDFGLAIPLTPNPGGIYAEDQKFDDLIEIHNYDFYNFINPVMRTHSMSRRKLEREMIKQEWSMHVKKDFWRYFHPWSKDRRERAFFRLSKSKRKVFAKMLRNQTINRLTGREENYNIKPEWYDD